MKAEGLRRIGESDLPTQVHRSEEYEKRKAELLSRIDRETEFTQGGAIHCKRCGKVKSLDMPERGVFLNCRCECMAEVEEERRKREERAAMIGKYRRMSLYELGEEYRKMRFEKLRMEAATEEFLTAAERCEKFCHNFGDVRKTGRGIWLYGSEKSGKTLLAACIVNELERESVPCIFTTLEKILTDLKTSYKSEAAMSEREIMQRLSRVDCLIIDDMEPMKGGRGAGESWATNRFAEIIKSRYDGKRPTVITSRLSLREMGIKGGLAQSVADRLVERQVVMQVRRRYGFSDESAPVEF